MALRKAALDTASKIQVQGFWKFLDPASFEEKTAICNRIKTLFPKRNRSQEIYSKAMWFTIEVCL